MIVIFILKKSICVEQTVDFLLWDEDKMYSTVDITLQMTRAYQRIALYSVMFIYYTKISDSKYIKIQFKI